MKTLFLFVCSSMLTVGSIAQKTTDSKDVKTMESNMMNWVHKNGYRLLIKFTAQNNASFYAEPNQDYAVFYIYDFDPNKQVSFKAYLMTPSDSLREKYTAHPTEIAKTGTAGGQVLQFSTNKKMLGGKAKLPVKLEADPKSRMYVYHKTRTT